MSLLTDEEISDIAISNPPDVHKYARAIESAVLAKLASAELPDIELTNLWNHMLAWHQAETKDCEKHADAATAVINSQLRQAYAQGAAAQLAQEPVATVQQYGEGVEAHLHSFFPIGTKLYTRRQA